MTIPRQETLLKAKLVVGIRKLLPQFLIIQPQDVRHRAYPDIATVGNGWTSWFEIKHGTPKFDSPGDQELMMRRLAVHGFARYILYLEDETGMKQVVIVYPEDIGLKWDDPASIPAYFGSKRYANLWVQGFNHDWVVHQIAKFHSVKL